MPDPIRATLIVERLESFLNFVRSRYRQNPAVTAASRTTSDNGGPEGATTVASVSSLSATREDIVAAYRLILRREPDEPGLLHYLDWVKDGRVTVGEVGDAFLSAAEYRSRFPTEPAATAVEIRGDFVFVDPAEPEFGRHIAAHGDWEPHLKRILDERLRSGQVFVDVGANVGVMAFAAARIVGPSGKVICFEPNRDNARNFLLGVRRNGFQSFVRFYPLALSDNGNVFAMEGSSNTFLVESNVSSRLVQAVPGDEILLNEQRIDFIKLDIEGHEPFALAGLAGTLKAHRPEILCEFNPRCLRDHIGRPPERFAEELFALSTRIEAIEHDGRSNTVRGPHELMDLWMSRNRQAAETGHLPDGMLHFDLLFRVDNL